MTRCLLGPIIWALFSLPIHAGSVEFAQWVPWNFISQELRKNEFLLNLNESAVTLSLGELRPVLSGISLVSKTNIHDLSYHKDSLLIAGQSSMILSLNAFKIDQKVVREVGGNVLEFRLQAECSAARVEINAISFQSTFILNRPGSSLPELNGMQFKMTPDQWKVSPIACEGPAGIGREIEQAINQGMNNPSSFSHLIVQWMKPWFDEWVKDQWITVSNPGEQWQDLRIRSYAENGFYLGGELPLRTSDENHELNSILPEDPDFTKPRFFIPREGWIALIEDKIRALIPEVYDLRQNESFRKLMSSRFLQFLTWPHLRKYHSSTPFVLKTDSSSLNLALTSVSAQWKAELAGKGTLTTLIGGSPIDYLVFGFKLSVPVKISLGEGILHVRTGKASARLDWKFGYLYQLLYSPDKNVPVPLLSGALAGVATGKSETFELPKFKIGDSVFVLGNLLAEDQLITMEWL